MRTRPLVKGGGLVLGLLLLLAGCLGEAPAADIVLVGGSVITLSGEGVVDGIAISGDTIVALGSERRIRRYVGPATRVVELGGRSVIPGLGDNHFHSIGGGPGVDLSRARTLQEVLGAISERARSTPPGEVIVTNSNWHEGQLAEQRLPYRDDLDRATDAHPVVVVRGGHEYILNSAALGRWGIDERTPEVSGGRIGRYPDGRLNGELVDRAKEYVSLPPTTPRARAAMLDQLEAEHVTLLSRGLTSIRYPGGPISQLAALEELKESGRLELRVEYLMRAPRDGSLAALREAMGYWPSQGLGDDWLRIGGVKLGVDGGFEGGLMRDPYEEPWGEGGTFYGLQTLPREAFVSAVLELHRAGYRVATHAVGDAAIDLVLDAYEVAHAEAPIDDRRWVIEHGFIPREDHFPRMQALGIGVTAQDHLYLAAPSLVQYWGPERAAWTTPLRAYVEAGIPVSIGTDSPVVPYDPWWALHHFTTRGTISAGVLDDDQAVSRLDALRAGTQGYAWLVAAEDRRGTLEPGKLADVVVTSESYLDCADPCLETMQVDLTVVGGTVMWER